MLVRVKRVTQKSYPAYRYKLPNAERRETLFLLKRFRSRLVDTHSSRTNTAVPEPQQIAHVYRHPRCLSFDSIRLDSQRPTELNRFLSGARDSDQNNGKLARVEQITICGSR